MFADKISNSLYMTKNLVLVGLMSAIFCILAPISIPLPFTPVPISFGILVVLLTSYVLEPKFAVISVGIYILLGLVGLPVFSGYSGGLGKIAGPTGGYIIGYLITAFISSFFCHNFKGKRLFHVVGMFIGVSFCMIPGTVWFSIQTGNSFAASLALCVYPFVLGDIVKIIIAALIGPEIQKSLSKIS